MQGDQGPWDLLWKPKQNASMIISSNLQNNFRFLFFHLYSLILISVFGRKHITALRITSLSTWPNVVIEQRYSTTSLWDLNNKYEFIYGAIEYERKPARAAQNKQRPTTTVSINHHTTCPFSSIFASDINNDSELW